MKYFKPLPFLLVLILSLSLALSCSKNDDNVLIEEKEEYVPVTLDNEIHDFIWQGMNEIYLWQSVVPNLSNNKFSTFDDYYTFLNSYNTPESLFDALLYKKDEVDKFSFIVDDYVALEKSFQGTTKTNGLDYRLVRLSGSNNIFGYVRYVANNSDAASKDIKRGDLFLTVDNQQLTINNYESLLFGSKDTYTLGMAEITNNTITSNGKTVTLTKTEFTENPIHIAKVIESNGTKIGYIMYNGFTSNFNTDLNNTFGDFKTQGINELVLDFRYNPGGSVNTAIELCSMITGQFLNDVIIKQQWNSKYQNYFEANAPESLVDRFTDKMSDGTLINSLNLNRVYILTTSGTASASELIINGLAPYIDVVQIGTNTTGKYTASVTLYDSENFGREEANPNHTYAIQPLVYKSANANGVTDYFNGLAPDYPITYQNSSGQLFEGENIINLGVLGDMNEPFLAKAIDLINGGTTKFFESSKDVKGVSIEHIAESNDFKPLGKGMYSNFKKME
ncbi:peptidase S41 [Tamlana fucoidanivorans]|uniref:Peptidase S41 n=1 Tax=Allotamlana fucoidanivorans TaxID=2583814 RepID=A0A5C4SIL9_9FLAO|nr:S41 family peptidase [Tamlana fucoidanivorans]TNJ43458.1 peptidase S41 [Tamlana fucoidanivorans]